MLIRPIQADEIDQFVEAGGPGHHEEVRQYVEGMFAAGAMRPEWCFVLEEEGRLLGRVALWALPGADRPLALVLLDVPWEEDDLTAGVLLRDVLHKARALGAQEIEHVLDSPPMYPQFQFHQERRAGLLERVGFALRRETIRFEWRGDRSPATSERLVFRTLEEVGDEAFVDAMAKVSEGTLDREIRDERERLGPWQAARAFFDDARDVKHEPSWWRLAYTPAGELVGLVMPAEPPAFLTIFYVGVVPAMRGRGYVDDLLAAGTATLVEAGSGAGDRPLRADTDIANAPMAAAFWRAGWEEFARRREYRVDLARIK
jgi:ribosomal protein S18 acetylase RimI-like enzyme